MLILRLEFFTYSVERPLRGFVALDNLGVLQGSEMSRHIGLRHAERFFDLANAHLPIKQQGQDPKAALFRQSFKCFNHRPPLPASCFVYALMLMHEYNTSY